MCRLLANSHRKTSPEWPDEVADYFVANDVRPLHRSLPEYQPTPLVALPALARQLGVGQVLVKDESHRFGLKAFKALGASYAVFKMLQQGAAVSDESLSVDNFYRTAIHLPCGSLTFCTATDGNHGRGVAWVARKLGQPAVIFMPSNTVQARIDNIEAEGARVVVVDGDYDKAVAEASRQAERYGWRIISDTSWPGYEEIPRWIQAGYRTLYEEIAEAAPDVVPDVVFVPGGVGALAATAAWWFGQPLYLGRTRLVCVEPVSADCLYRSAAQPDGSTRQSPGRLDSIMAGLNCGTVSTAAWPLIRDRFDAFLAISDTWARQAMQRYYHPSGNDPRIVAGESGAATLGGLLALSTPQRVSETREVLGMATSATILVLNTEGDTDPDSHSAIVSSRTH